MSLFRPLGRYRLMATVCLTAAVAAGTALTVVPGDAARADGGKREHRERGQDLDRVSPITDPLVAKECGACHMAFPAAFLPAESWQAVMGGLSSHFGEDASLPADKVQAITAVLVAQAGPWPRGVAAGQVPLRISDLPWWTRKHRPGEVSAAAMAKAGSKANCKACHADADRGIFEDD